MTSKINILSHTILYIFIGVLLIALIYASTNLGSKNNDISKKNIKAVIEKTVMQCYASEGSYPNDLEYLEKNYGLIMDRENYIYEYHVFSSNIMPEIIIHDNIRKNIKDE